MTAVLCVVFLILTFLWTLTRADTDVSCVYMENCILPCSIQGSSDVVIHWVQTEGNVPVHAYYDDQDQLAFQALHIRNRTSLFKDQILRGNISLQLTGVKVQDQGRYKCYSDGQEKHVVVKVYAPVNKVDIHQVENSITCSSEGIYPEPELTWSTNPPIKITFNTTTRVQQTKQQLYNISSSLILSDPGTDVVYSCTISTRRNKRRTALFRPISIIEFDTESSVDCADSDASFSNLVWRFNHSEIILTQKGTDVPDTVSKQWRQHVKSVSESGSLTLQHLTSDQEGTYSCELHNAEETFQRETLLIFVKIKRTEGRVLYNSLCCTSSSLFVLCISRKNNVTNQVKKVTLKCDPKISFLFQQLQKMLESL
uniref:Ig-like domain-containing protein n=1 Tax=Anabas testudineus TaxID=64144 RepID=A0A3Q1J656_ANATE